MSTYCSRAASARASRTRSSKKINEKMPRRSHLRAPPLRKLSRRDQQLAWARAARRGMIRLSNGTVRYGDELAAKRLIDDVENLIYAVASKKLRNHPRSRDLGEEDLADMR